jgi:hypothetical protein
MPLGKLWPNRRSATRARGVITSELGQKRKWRRFQVMSALPQKADIDARDCDVRFVPSPEVAASYAYCGFAWDDGRFKIVSQSSDSRCSVADGDSPKSVR